MRVELVDITHHYKEYIGFADAATICHTCGAIITSAGVYLT
jgi:hypothetical protein